MAIKKTDRDAVIEAALALFRIKGYHHTSIADIAGACGLLKGSIYHYFPGKEALALAALDAAIDDVRDRLFKYAHDTDTPAPERLRRLGDGVERFFIDRDGGCVIGNLTLEVGASIPEMETRIRRYFDEWKAALVAILGDAYGPLRAAELAEDAVARVQGAVMLMNVYNDPAILRRAKGDIASLLGDSTGEPATLQAKERVHV
jgi:AcrR family transcriptional regulator